VPSDEGPKAEKNPGEGTQPTDVQERITAIGRALHSLVEEYKSKNEKQHAANLTKNRWDRWTTAGVWLYTVLTAAIMVVGVRQFVTTRSQTKYQLRGYIYVDPSIDFEVGRLPLYKISVVDGGQTPITHINGTLHVHFAPAAEVDKPSGPPPGYASDRESLSAEGDFAYQKKTFDYSLPIKGDTVVDQATYDSLFVSRKVSLYLWGRVDFLDVFRDKHWLTYCYFYPPPKETGGSGNMGVCSHGNDMDSDE
jgi:hypothetical protein